MMENNFVLVSTISGRTFKFSREPSPDLLIDLPNGIIIGLTTSICVIDCYIKDENDIYNYSGDISFASDNGKKFINFHSRAIASLSFNGESVSVPDSSNSLSDVKIGLAVDKSIKWFDDIKKQF